jgi:hypothetical protein
MRRRTLPAPYLEHVATVKADAIVEDTDVVPLVIKSIDLWPDVAHHGDRYSDR